MRHGKIKKAARPGGALGAATRKTPRVYLHRRLHASPFAWKRFSRRDRALLQPPARPQEGRRHE